MFSDFDSYFVFGKRGRFGSSFIKYLEVGYSNVKGYGSFDFNQGVSDLVACLREGKSVLVIWCLGSGSSVMTKGDSIEYKSLHNFFIQLHQGKTLLTSSRFVYISTGGKMYGKNKVNIKESAEILPICTYGIQKRKCERLIQMQSSSFFYQTDIFRLANAYTLRRMNPNPQGFIEHCLSAIEFKKQLIVTVDPASNRQYGSHVDYARYILRFIWQNIEHTGCAIRNIAPKFSYELLQVVQLFERHFHLPVDFSIKSLEELERDDIYLESEYQDVQEFTFAWKTIEENLDLLDLLN